MANHTKEEEIVIDEINPIFDPLKIKKRISPASGFLSDGDNDFYYFGFNMPCEIVGKTKHGKIKLHKNELILVKSNRSMLICDERNIAEYNYEIDGDLIQKAPRWSISHMGKWLQGDDYSPKIESLEPLKIFGAVRERYEFYCAFQKEEWYDLLTLWTIGTYFFNMFSTYPMIYLYGLKNVGKTKIMEISSYMAFNGQLYISITPASLFRITQANRPSLFMDEIEKMLDIKREGSADIEAMLNSGYKRGASVPRCEKEGNKQIVNTYDVYCPKMFAHVEGNVGRTLLSRCIRLVAQRANPNDKRAERLPIDTDAKWQSIRNELYIFALENYERILYYYNGDGKVSKIEGIDNRDWEIWRPLLAISKMVSDEVYENIKRLALEMVNEIKKEETESREYTLVKVLDANIVDERYYFVSEIRAWMADEFENPEDIPTHKMIGRDLKRLGLTDRRREGNKGTKWYLSRKITNELVMKIGIIRETTPITTQTTPDFNDKIPQNGAESVISEVIEMGDEARNMVKSGVVSAVSVITGGLSEKKEENKIYGFTPTQQTTQTTPKTLNLVEVIEFLFDDETLLTTETIIQTLMEKFNITEKQADYLVRLKLKEGLLYEPRKGMIGLLR